MCVGVRLSWAVTINRIDDIGNGSSNFDYFGITNNKCGRSVCFITRRNLLCLLHNSAKNQGDGIMIKTLVRPLW